MSYRSLADCPNCKREFYPMGSTRGEYCPECWRAWCESDDAFKRREKPWPWQSDKAAAILTPSKEENA